MTTRILAINPGSTSTKAVLFADGERLADVEIAHPHALLAACPTVMDQLEARITALREALDKALGETGPLSAVVGRGGFLAPLPGGAYQVSEAMLAELRVAAHGEHASNLGAFMAVEFAAAHGCPALVVDPVATDELMDEARVTGLPFISRRSIFHALGQRGAAREAARRLGVDYATGRFVVAQLGGGVSVGAHREGRVVDVTNALDGEGPFTAERSGALPLLPLLALIESGERTPAGLRAELTRNAGLKAHLGTSDLREVEARIETGDEAARLVFAALAYNVAKSLASMAPALEGRVDAVVLTGGMARSARLVDEITRLAGFLGPVVAVTGLEEMQTMADGAARALSGQAPILAYPPVRRS